MEVLGIGLRAMNAVSVCLYCSSYLHALKEIKFLFLKQKLGVLKGVHSTTQGLLLVLHDYILFLAMFEEM